MTPFLAAALLAVLVAGTLAARWAVRPVGRHRAGILAPVEALVQVDAHCRSCRHTTRHAILRVHGEHICRSCGCLNTAVQEVT
ncbi:hypothetical protein DF268_08725 [Streptomyces sp. V2]|uniref:hypothetical protein n=1 Tax=Streptomyces sp. V2 TaxID=1424099 RepID=UPI000D6716A8|nr:hypothetical protein [Streptomyces sp. V2]PWG13938.1 hypothetical protein DF268_08725 [Streptomyces sp. V2]